MNRLKEIRNERKLTLDEIQNETGINRSTYNNYESGKTKPKPETWQALADYFNVSVPYLQGKVTYGDLDILAKGIYDYVSEAMDRVFDDYAILPESREKILKAIAYSIDDGEFI